LRRVIGALAAALGRQPAWSGRAADAQALTGAAIDLAEEGSFWVVLDDLHHAEASVVSDLLVPAARYARRVRWIAVTRIDPGIPDLGPQVVALGSMPHGDLVRLARKTAPAGTPADLRRAATAAGGSPWRLQQILASRGMEPATLEKELPEGLARGSLDLLHALALIELPLSPATIARCMRLPPPPALEALERRGLIERTPSSIRLHEVARPLVRAAASGVDMESIRARMASALARLEDPAALLEALRLFLERGRSSEARALLDRCGAGLLAGGYAPRLWRLLETTDEGFARWRLRCAAEIGSPEALAKLPEPPRSDPADRLLWARALFDVDRIPEAAEVAAEVAAHPAGSEEIAFEATLLRARCLGMLGEAGAAVTVLERLRPAAPDALARRDASLARWLVEKGEGGAALRLIAEVARRAPALGAAARREVHDRIATAYIFLGSMSALQDLLAMEKGEQASELSMFRDVLVSRATALVFGGHLRPARDLIERLRTFSGRSTTQGLYADFLDFVRRLSAGELVGLVQAAESLLSRSESRRNAHVYCWTRVWREHLALLRGEPHPHRPWPPSISPATGSEAAHFALLEWQRALRAGERARVPVLAGGLQEFVMLRIHRGWASTEAAILEGDLARAGEEALQAIGISGEQGQELLGAEARQVLCEARLAQGDGEGLSRAAAELREIGRSFPSPRFSAEARFFALACARQPLDPPILEELALQDEVAPVAARRARALLGAPSPLDALDRIVTGAFSRTAGGARIRTLREAPGPWRPGWGIDTTRGSVWLPGGRRVGLRARPLHLRILEAIAERGGSLGKEGLLGAVWGVEPYHPLRHDARIQMAIHRLRQVIEDDPADPRRVVATPEGYAFGESEPVRILG
jgi:hypothetical protein